MPHAQNQHLAEIVKRNIRTLLEVRRQIERRKSMQDRVADAITNFSGSMTFAYLHLIWFGIWIMWNTGKLGLPPFDPFPYGLLTMIVSLEAIFLSTFVLVSQNRLGAVADQRADLDLHVNLLAEYEVTKILKLVDEIARHQHLQVEGKEIKELEKSVHPEELLQELEREHEALQV